MNKKGGGNSSNRANLFQFLHHTRLPLEETLFVLAAGKTTVMQSLAAKVKRIHQMLSHIWSFCLLLCLYLFRPKSKCMFWNSLCCTLLLDPSGKTLWTFCSFCTCWESILGKRVYRDCLNYISCNNIMYDMVKLDTVDFYVILCMDWLHAFYVSIYCRSWVVKFQTPNESVIEWSSSSVVFKGPFISYLRERKLVLNGCIYYIVRVDDYSVEVPK